LAGVARVVAPFGVSQLAIALRRLGTFAAIRSRERVGRELRDYGHIAYFTMVAEEPITAICSAAPIGNHKVAFPNLEMTESTARASAAAPGQEFR
jgi:hypothetical protein